MTVTEAAKALGLSPQAIQFRLKNGQMQGTLVHPRLWLIPNEEVERWRRIGRLKRGRKPRQQRGEDQP